MTYVKGYIKQKSFGDDGICWQGNTDKMFLENNLTICIKKLEKSSISFNSLTSLKGIYIIRCIHWEIFFSIKIICKELKILVCLNYYTSIKWNTHSLKMAFKISKFEFQLFLKFTFNSKENSKMKLQQPITQLQLLSTNTQ